MLMQYAFKVLYLSWIATEIYVLLVTRTRAGGGAISDRGSLRVLWITIMSSITLGMWVGGAYTSTRIHNAFWLVRVAVALLAIGLAIRWTAIYTLGKSFSANVAIHAAQTLNRSGLFRFARHPSYSGMILIFFGMGLSTHNWLGVAIIGVPSFLLPKVTVETPRISRYFLRMPAQFNDYRLVSVAHRNRHFSAAPVQIYCLKT